MARHDAEGWARVLRPRMAAMVITAAILMLLAACGGIHPEGVIPPPAFEPDPVAESNVVIHASTSMVVEVAGATLRASQLIDHADPMIEYYYRAPVGRHLMFVTASGRRIYEGHIEVGETGISRYTIAADGSLHSVTVGTGAPIGKQPNE